MLCEKFLSGQKTSSFIHFLDTVSWFNERKKEECICPVLEDMEALAAVDTEAPEATAGLVAVTTAALADIDRLRPREVAAGVARPAEAVAAAR